MGRCLLLSCLSRTFIVNQFFTGFGTESFNVKNPLWVVQHLEDFLGFLPEKVTGDSEILSRDKVFEE